MYKNWMIYFQLVVVILGTLLLPTPLLADGFSKFTSSNFGFTFEYPSSWEIRPPVFPNARAVVGPKNGEVAECAIFIKLVPDTKSMSQKDIDNYFSQKTILSEAEESYKLQYNDVQVIAIGNSMLDNRPARVERVRLSAGSQEGKGFVYSLSMSAGAPGQIWTVGCSGLGRSSREAEKNFNKHQMDINRLISTFRFK
jgi:hypothetical protein